MLLKKLIIIFSLIFYADQAISSGSIELPSFPLKKNNLYIFISFSMPDSLIKSYLTDAALVDGALIIRGVDEKLSLSDFVFKKILPLVQYNDINAKIDINPILFNTYYITHVPTIVYSDSENKQYWKLSGAVSLLWALETFQENGADVQSFIEKFKNKRSLVNKYELAKTN